MGVGDSRIKSVEPVLGSWLIAHLKKVADASKVSKVADVAF
jgi:hypothetical protein